MEGRRTATSAGRVAGALFGSWVVEIGAWDVCGAVVIVRLDHVQLYYVVFICAVA